MSDITSGGAAHPTTTEGWRKLAQAVLDHVHKNHNEAALALAHFVVNAVTPERDFVALVDNFNATSRRCSEILEERRALQRIIENVANFEGDKREHAIEALIEKSRSQR
jgi:hypothetical protein